MQMVCFAFRYSDSVNKGQRTREVAEAWIGDAVLTLYARRRILREEGVVNNARLELMTSNHFLSALGEPTGVEAGIGRVYERDGLDAAFEYIETNIMPMYARQEDNRNMKPRAQRGPV